MRAPRPKVAARANRNGLGVRVLRIARDGVAVIVSLAMGFACLWNVVPAPTLPLLAFAVIVPELAPWFFVGSAVALVLAVTLVGGRGRAISVVALVASLALSLVPISRVPATIAAARDAFATAFPSASATYPGPGPFDLAASFMGYPLTHAPVVRRNLPVRARDGTSLALDLYEPAARAALPVVVLIYGGAWRFGSRGDVAELAGFLTGAGYAVVVLDYRHAPDFVFPTQLDDVRAGLATVAANARAWNLDLGRVALFGRSAGAELALLAAYEPEPFPVRAAIGYYAPTDLRDGYARPPRPDPAHVRRILRDYLGGPPAGRDAAYRAASPIDLVRPGLPATFLVSGKRDELVRPEQQRRMVERLQAAGDRVLSIEIPWSNHAFDVVPGGLGSQIARYYTERFLAATLAP